MKSNKLSDKEKFELLKRLVDSIVADSKDLDPKISKIVDSDFWDLV